MSARPTDTGITIGYAVAGLGPIAVAGSLVGVRDGSGVGLGLAVARGFVEAMDGEVVVEDTPGGGLTMVLRLPAVTL